MSEIEIVSPANAIERVIGVIEMLAVSDEPLRLSEIAQQFDIPKSAVHRISRAAFRIAAGSSKAITTATR